MIPSRQFISIFAFAFLSAASCLKGTNTTPCGGSGGKGPCGQNDTGATSGIKKASLEWSINLGLARYQKPQTLVPLSKIANLRNGTLADFKEFYKTLFQQGPMQQSQIRLEISEPMLSEACYHPSILFIESDALFATMRKPAFNGAPEYIHQVLTDDGFTLIDLLPSPDVGWRLRVWKRDAAPLVKVGNFYDPTGFLAASVPPLTDVIFKKMNPQEQSSENKMIYIQKETTGVSSTATRITTDEIIQEVDTNTKFPTKLTSKLYSGEGTSRVLLFQEDLEFSERESNQAWDYTIIRKVMTASMGENGTPGPLVLTRKTLEDYDDFSRESEDIYLSPTGVDSQFVQVLIGAGVIKNYGPPIGIAYKYKKLTDHKHGGGLPGMKRLVELIEAYETPGQEPQESRFTYFKDLTPEPGANFFQSLMLGNVPNPNGGIPDLTGSTIHGRMKSAVKPDGSWTFTEHVNKPESSVTVQTDYSGWKNQQVAFDGDDRLTDACKAAAKKVVKTVSGPYSKTETFVGSQLVGLSESWLNDIPGLSSTREKRFDGTQTHETVTAYYSDSDAAPSTGRIKWIENSDGTAATFTYLYSTGTVIETERVGSGNRNGVTAGTEYQRVYKAVPYTGVGGRVEYGTSGIPISEVTKYIDTATNIITEQWVTDPTYNGGFDRMGRPIKRIFNGDVADYDIRQYACCGLEFSRERGGNSKSYFRDGLKRVYKVEERAYQVDQQLTGASPPVTDFTAVNGLTTTRTRRVGNPGSVSDSLFLGSTTTSLDGLTTVTVGPSKKSNSPADRPTTTEVTAHSATGDTVTRTYADLSTSITSYYVDGRIKSVGGTAVPDRSFDYTTHTEFGGGLKTISNESGVVVSTYEDLMGRTRKVVSSATGTSLYQYHPITAPLGSRGALMSVTDGDNVVVSYGYNAKGERTTESRSIPLASGTATRVTTTTRDVVPGITIQGFSLGKCFRETTSLSSSGVAAITTSVSYASTDGLSQGNVSLGRSSLNVKTRPNSSFISTDTTTFPDGTKSVSTTTNGLVTSVKKHNTTGGVVTGKTYTYDALQRLLTVTDLRTGADTYDVDGNGAADTTESGAPLAVRTAAGFTTTYGYDLMGRRTTVDAPDTVDASGNPLTNISYTAYHPTGQVKATWGAQTYPTWYVYDEQDRMTQLHTWKIAPALDLATIPADPPSGSAVTTWIYGAATGLLDRKQYADAKGTDYTYTSAGRLKTREWARTLPSSTTRLKTTYTYTNGFQTFTDYNDATPDVSTTYDALGRLSTVTQNNQSQIAYAYDPATLAVDTETVKYDIDNNGAYEFTRVLDRRPTTLGRDTGWELKDGSTIENQVTYGYSPTDGRLATVTGGGNVAVPQAFTYGYTPNSDLIATVVGSVHTVTNTWEPNRDVLDIKENKVGTNLVSKYDYSVNEIGQRTEVVSSLGAFSNSYSLSNLWRWKYDSKGQIKSEITNGLGGETRIYSYDDIGNRQIETTEINRPTVGPISSSRTYNVNSVNQYLDVGGLTWTHDDDGNVSLQQIGVGVSGPSSIPTQILQWDGENRLNSSTKNNIQAAYLYDAFSRRIAKISSNSQTTTAYIYDGWNCVAEYSKNSSSSSAVSITSAFLWGRDLSENLQGAGGVGGLLSTFMKSTSSSVANLYSPTYDGNGNIREYLDQSGSVVVHYDYDPYGKPTATTGFAIPPFTYGFSTKPRDIETGLYYYGYRYYDPATGRWPSRDLIEERGGVNLYGFVFNDPTDGIDILGLDYSIECQRCTKKNGDFKLKCLINKDGVAIHSFTANDYNESRGPTSPGKDDGVGNEPKKSNGKDGPLGDGKYDVVNSETPMFGPNTPMITNIGKPGKVQTPDGVIKQGVVFHVQKRHSQGCITINDCPNVNDLPSPNPNKEGENDDTRSPHVNVIRGLLKKQKSIPFTLKSIGCCTDE